MTFGKVIETIGIVVAIGYGILQLIKRFNNDVKGSNKEEKNENEEK